MNPLRYFLTPLLSFESHSKNRVIFWPGFGNSRVETTAYGQICNKRSRRSIVGPTAARCVDCDKWDWAYSTELALYHPAGLRFWQQQRRIRTLPEIELEYGGRPALLTQFVSLSIQFAGIAGPGLGALLIQLGGTGLAFGLDAASFLISAFCIFQIRHFKLNRTTAEAPPGVLKDIREGLRVVAGTPWLWITIAIFALVNITLEGPFSISLPFFVSESLNADVGVLGLIYSFAAAGSLLATLWLGRVTQLRRRGLTAYAAAIVSRLTMFFFALPVGLVGVLAASLFRGLGITIFSLIWTNTLQEMVPRDLLGRVSSVDILGSSVMLPIGFGIAGFATDALGPSLVFLIGGVLTTLLLVAGLLHPSVRNLD